MDTDTEAYTAMTLCVMHEPHTEFVRERGHIGARDGAEDDGRVLARIDAVLRVQRVQHPLQEAQHVLRSLTMRCEGKASMDAD